jgi:hypothetical protein
MLIFLAIRRAVAISEKSTQMAAVSTEEASDSRIVCWPNLLIGNV